MQQALVAARTGWVLRTVHSGEVVWQTRVCKQGSGHSDRITPALAQGTTDTVCGLESTRHQNRNLNSSANGFGVLGGQAFEPVRIDDAVAPERLRDGTFS